MDIYSHPDRVLTTDKLVRGAVMWRYQYHTGINAAIPEKSLILSYGTEEYSDGGFMCINVNPGPLGSSTWPMLVSVYDAGILWNTKDRRTSVVIDTNIRLSEMEITEAMSHVASAGSRNHTLVMALLERYQIEAPFMYEEVSKENMYPADFAKVVHNILLKRPEQVTNARLLKPDTVWRKHEWDHETGKYTIRRIVITGEPVFVKGNSLKGDLLQVPIRIGLRSATMDLAWVSVIPSYFGIWNNMSFLTK